MTSGWQMTASDAPRVLAWCILLALAMLACGSAGTTVQQLVTICPCDLLLAASSWRAQTATVTAVLSY